MEQVTIDNSHTNIVLMESDNSKKMIQPYLKYIIDVETACIIGYYIV